MLEVKKEKPTAFPGTVREKVQSQQPGSFCLAHISDLHLTSLLNAKNKQLMNNRLLGYLSWKRKRRLVHRREIVESLVKDLNEICPDHVAVTGDLTHIGLPDEFAEAAQWLPNLGSPENVTVIPGNHEAYAGLNWARNLSSWASFLLSDDQQGSPETEDLFPLLRVRGQVALIGLCSARPSLPFLAVGSLGKKQLKRLAKLLMETGDAGLMRVILVHHPPVPGTTNWRKRLVDSEAFSDVVSRHGAELILHGHTHTSTLKTLQRPTGVVPVVGAPSASELNPRKGRCAGYNLYRIKRNGSSWDLSMTVRRYSEETAAFVEEQEIALDTPRL